MIAFVQLLMKVPAALAAVQKIIEAFQSALAQLQEAQRQKYLDAAIKKAEEEGDVGGLEDHFNNKR